MRVAWAQDSPLAPRRGATQLAKTAARKAKRRRIEVDLDKVPAVPDHEVEGVN